MICHSVSVAMEKLVQSGLASRGSLQGCTPEEIASIDSHFGLRLPQCYRDFLTQVGRCAGAFLVGFDYSFPKMFEFRDWAGQMIQQSGWSFSLPKIAYVFFFDPAGAFLFFHCNGDPDPPVLMFIETENDARKVFDTFSDWLLGVIQDHITIRDQRQNGGRAESVRDLP